MSKKRHPKSQQMYDFIRAHRSHWETKTSQNAAKYIILRLETWLLQNNIFMEKLTGEQLEQFLEHGKYKPLQEVTRGNYRSLIRLYVAWLSENRNILFVSFESLIPDAEFKKDRNLPEDALEFLVIQKVNLPYDRFIVSRAAIIRFYICLKKENIDIADINGEVFKKFSKYLQARGLHPCSRKNSLTCLRKFLEWLNEFKGMNLSFEEHLPKFRYASLRYLTEDNKSFLNQIKTTLRPSTCNDYRGSLSQLSKFFSEHKISIKNIDRSQIEFWLQWLHGKPHSITHRRKQIIHLRVYLMWLHERGKLSCDPTLLIKPIDFPKVPKLLPRPLPREIDLELIIRLENSSNIHLQGLLLMRRTGLRIGELHSLKFDCIRKDSSGFSYLKVELGKLNSERLVPINENIIALIKTIQTQSSENWKNKNRTRSPEHLLIDLSGKHAKYWNIFRAFQQIRQGIPSAEPLVPHRFRHTYATELLSSGMSHTSIMHILGHRSINMTLRYAAVVPETTHNEYMLAVQKMNQAYQVPNISLQKEKYSKEEPSFKDFIQWTKKILDDPKHLKNKSKLLLILKRMHRLQSEIESIISEE